MKKHTFFKVAMMLLALVLIVSCFASCNKDNNDPKDSDPTDSSTKTPDGDASGEATNTPDTGKDTEGPAPHVHTFGAWEVTTPATCKTEGERENTPVLNVMKWKQKNLRLKTLSTAVALCLPATQ